MNEKAIVFGIVLLLVGLGGGYYFATNYKLVPQISPAGSGSTTTPDTQQTSESLTPTSTQSITGSPTPTADETAALITAVKAGLVAEHGSNASSMNVTVSKIQGNTAKGGAIDPGSVGGAMWLAAKVSGEWKLVWDGNGTISCEKTDPYDFPISMVPECWNEATGKLITH